MPATPLRQTPPAVRPRRGMVLADPLDDAAHDDAEHDDDAAASLDDRAPADLAGDGLVPEAPDAHDHAVSAAARPRAGAAELDDAGCRALIDRIVARDERALATLYDAAGARVYGLVLRIVRRPTMAEEVLEDTFWQVWRQAPRFDPARGQVMGWVLAMARSRAIDALRRESRSTHAPLPEDNSHEAIADPTADTPDLLDATRGAERVHAALATLEPRARQLVALAFFRGLTHEEIAEQTGTPLGTVKSLIRRALLQLRQQLA